MPQQRESGVVIFDDLEALKRKVDQLRTNKERAEGALNQILKRIKEEFGCKNLQEAEALLIQLQNEEREAASDYTKEKKRFEKRHQKVLSTVS